MKIISTKNAKVFSWLTSIFVHTVTLAILFLWAGVGGRHITSAKPLPVFEASIASFGRSAPDGVSSERVAYSSVNEIATLFSDIEADAVEPIELDILPDNISRSNKASYQTSGYLTSELLAHNSKFNSGIRNDSESNVNGDSTKSLNGDNVGHGSSNGVSGSNGNGSSTTTGVPSYKYNPPPPYPLEARKNGLEGLVVLTVRVSADGICNDISVRQSSGYSILDNTAVDAVCKWRFTPAMDGDIPVESFLEVPIRFKLKG
ncbi:MAG: hypothetical protein A2W23_09360 [Planctomycetes bacterium RBG_16_43_13]|nr:MAG: hypothetical protein A2W23_09360 [Planctomycetes bacterium RBG_16_43_13]